MKLMLKSGALQVVGKSHYSWDIFYRWGQFHFRHSFKFLAFFIKP